MVLKTENTYTPPQKETAEMLADYLNLVADVQNSCINITVAPAHLAGRITQSLLMLFTGKIVVPMKVNEVLTGILGTKGVVDFAKSVLSIKTMEESLKILKEKP